MQTLCNEIRICLTQGVQRRASEFEGAQEIVCIDVIHYDGN